MTETLLDCIRSIKQKYNKYGQFKNIVEQKTSTIQEMQQKIRSMTIAFQVIAQQNSQMMRIHSTMIAIAEEKQNQIRLKEVQIKKYRGQILDLVTKNEELVNYSRKLANQYTTLLNSMKDNQQIALKRQASAISKIKMMQNQVCFLRQNILLKNKQQQKFDKKNRVTSQSRLSRPKSRGRVKKSEKQNYSQKNRKSFVHLIS